MLEDEQRFEELEAKLAALSSQVEGLELENEVDPFFEDDVRRLLEDFREKEISQVEEIDDELEESEDLGSGLDFIDVQTAGGRTFKVHWIAPDSCENMTKATARDAFASGAASRYGTSQQVNSGDVLILLCRKPTVDSSSTSESESEIPEKFCHYIGMAVNTGFSPSSAEPPATEEEVVTTSVGNYEIFVWSSCECVAEGADSVTLTALTAESESDSGSSTPNSYAKVGTSGSSLTASAEGLVSDLEVVNAEEQVPIDTIDDVVLGGKKLTDKKAGFISKLKSLSEKLVSYYINYSSQSLDFEAATKNIDTVNFSSDLFTSKTFELTGSECGGLKTVSISSSNLNLIQAGDSISETNSFVNSVKLSLGEVTEKNGLDDGKNGIHTYRAATADDITHPAAKNVFLPVLSEADSEAIEPLTSDLSFLLDYDVTIEASFSVIYESEGKGDAEYRFYKKEKNLTDVDFASGLLVNSGTEVEDTAKVLLGIIRVQGVPLKYGCVETYGCQPDPAGEYDDPNCDGSCVSEEEPFTRILTFRPAKIYFWDPSWSTTNPYAVYHITPGVGGIEEQSYDKGHLYLDAQNRIVFNETIFGERDDYGRYYAAGG